MTWKKSNNEATEQSQKKLESEINSMGVTEKYQDLDEKCLRDSIKFVVLFF